MKLHSQRLQTVDEIRAFLSGSTTFDFELHSREEAYRWIQDTLRQFGYLRLGRPDRRVVQGLLEEGQWSVPRPSRSADPAVSEHRVYSRSAGSAHQCLSQALYLYRSPILPEVDFGGQ